ncbi:MAG: NAD(+)/NADH kinase [Oscillospiraceae bacterium]|nr:NAD(+)/NADH kinase [Oscillospiraceae bacterium]
MKRIILCPNPKRDFRFEITEKVKNLLEALGAQPTVCLIDDLSGDVLKRGEALITFGGDGTILHAARKAADYSLPILGVNLGKKGFIAELEKDRLDLIGNIVLGSFRIEERLMLNVSVMRKGEKVLSDCALNDVIVGGMARIINLSVCGDGQKMLDFSGDGVVFATPTGSTAYSLSAGGPLVEPDSECIVVTPICPHALSAKPYVLNSSRTVSAEVGELGRKIAYISTDGSMPLYLESGDIITVTRSERTARLIKLTDKSFYERVSEKLGDRS